MKKFVRVTTATGIALIFGLTQPAFPHGVGVIRLASRDVVKGGTIALTGEKLEKNSDLRLELRGILDNYPAGRIRTDANGRVSARLTIPPAVPIGAYTLVAIADDGDVAARTDLSIGPVAAVDAAAKGMPHMATEMPGVATAEMMKIERTTTRGEWAVIISVIVLSFTAGGLMLRRSRRAVAA